MPAGSKVLTAQAQGEDLVLWAVVTPTNPPEVRRVECFPTGGDAPAEYMPYVGTAQFLGGVFVVHVFISEFGAPHHNRGG